MATNFHQPSVQALFDAMPLALITFGVNGLATFANRAARIHTGKPVEAMSGRIVIKNLAQAITLGKIKLPYAAEVGVADGKKLKGIFMAGPSGLDIAFVAAPPEPEEEAHAGPGVQSRMGLEQIIELLQDEVGPPMRKLTGMLGSLPESDEGNRLELAADELKERLRRLADLLAVFGEEAMLMDDRMDLGALVDQTLGDLRPKATQAKVRFEVKPPNGTLPPIYGNARLIKRALYECFDNALTHSRREVKGGLDCVVQIGYTLTGEHVLISVRNQGAIAPEDKGIETRDLFAARNPNHANGRLGLPLVNRIVGLHGGNMRMSIVDGEDTRVMIEFPTGAPQRGQANLDMEQAQRYAADLAQLMQRRKKEDAT
ncbi:MAG: HAMP domain-containing sensor histidine kinase [Rhodoferax sp.]|nr:HAMP domain-containing sensor histidine kinase [Rhodoferax sp.]